MGDQQQCSNPEEESNNGTATDEDNGEREYGQGSTDELKYEQINNEESENDSEEAVVEEPPPPSPQVIYRPKELTEEELIERANAERAAIVRKYDKGREKDAQIDPWEDPAFEIYHVTDRYGFIHDKRLPRKADIQEQKLRVVERERVKKWVKMIKTWPKYYGGDKLRRRIYKGIPDAVRGAVWASLMDLERAREEQQGKYQEMRSLARDWSPDIRQIDLDVNRTYRDHIMFREKYGLKQQALFHVLGAYSMYNSEIGYCQGMSQIAALLLMYLDEEDTFWGLSALMANPKYAMHGFFIPGFPKLLRFQEHHDRIMKKFLPRLKQHMDRNGVDTGLYTLKWFFQCFLDRIPFTLTLRLWDAYLLDGERVPVAMAYTILKLHRRQLLRVNMDDMLSYLQIKLEKDFGFEDDAVMEALEKNMEELRKNHLDLPSKTIPPGELPQKPFGMFAGPPTPLKQAGLRSDFTNSEKLGRDAVIKRRDEAYHSATTQNSNGIQRMSYADGSFDQSLDESSSLCDLQNINSHRSTSRVSLAATSATSAADLSIFSAATYSRSHKDDIDEVQSGHSTPVNQASPSVSPKQVVTRIYVPYAGGSNTLSPPVAIRNGVSLKSNSSDPNRITIHIESRTPSPSMSPFRLDNLDSMDLK